MIPVKTGMASGHRDGVRMVPGRLGQRLEEEGRARILAAFETGNTSLYATGSTPGFITDQLPFALLSVQRHVNSLVIDEYSDLHRRESTHMIFEQLGFGRPLAEFHANRRAAYLLDEYTQSLADLAEAAGFAIDEWSALGEAAVARKDTTIVAGEIRAGTVAAQRATLVGRSAGVDVLRYTPYYFCSMDVQPAWDLRPMGWHVKVDGDAPFDVQIDFPVPPADFASYTPGYTANPAVNAIPYVCAAAPGFLLTEDLPPMTPAGPRAQR